MIYKGLRVYIYPRTVTLFFLLENLNPGLQGRDLSDIVQTGSSECQSLRWHPSKWWCGSIEMEHIVCRVSDELGDTNRKQSVDNGRQRHPDPDRIMQLLFYFGPDNQAGRGMGSIHSFIHFEQAFR